MASDDPEPEIPLEKEEEDDTSSPKEEDHSITKPTASSGMTYREKALANGIKYTVTDVPPLPTALMLGVQHYLTMLGATVLIPLILCPAMGANGDQTAEVISSIFFVSGINTLVQTSIGDRCVRRLTLAWHSIKTLLFDSQNAVTHTQITHCARRFV